MAYVRPGQYTIFTNNNFHHLADPQATWLFDVQFMSDDPTTDNNALACAVTNGTLIATSVTLPSYKTEIVTRKYFGSERSYPIIRTYGGDCDITFDVRGEDAENSDIDSITQLSSRFRKVGSDIIGYHPEFRGPKDNNSKLGRVWRFDKIIVNIKNKIGLSLDQNGSNPYPLVNAQYEYKNCVITNFAFNEGLDYASDSKLTCKLTFHYDIWSKLL